MTGELAAEVAQLCAAGEDAHAIETGERLLNRAPDDVDLRLRMGFVYGALEQFDNAFVQLDAAAQHSAGARADVFAQRARLEAFSGRGDAKASANRAIEIDPLQPQSTYFLAEHHWRGDYVLLKDARVVCSPIPKSATTSLKHLFDQMEPAADGERVHRRFGGPRMRRDRLRLGQLRIEGFYRFAVVRDDSARFQSYHRRNVVQAESLRRAGHGLDTYLGLTTVPSIDELANQLARYQFVFLDVRHHTLPTSAYLHHDADFYDDIFALDQIDLLVERLVAHTGTRYEVAHKLASTVAVDTALSADTAHALREYYRS